MILSSAPWTTITRSSDSAAEADRPLIAPLRFGALVAILALHAPLALMMQRNEALATTHVVLTVGVVLFLTVSTPRPGPLLHAAGYVVGSEVLWRQTGADAPWELGKYLLILLFVGGIVRFVPRPRRVTTVVVLLAALLPACVVPLAKLPPLGALEPIVFNVGGLFALGLGVVFVSHLTGSWRSIRPTLWCVVAPVVGTTAIASVSTRHLAPIDFINESNFGATGGFGPNQVSTILGFGGLCLFFLAVKETTFARRMLAVGLAIWFLTQGGLTFSRGGLLNVVAAVLVSLPFLIKQRTVAKRVLVVMLIIGLLAVLVVIPRLSTFTGGALETRFTDTRERDQRTTLVDRDVELFLDNPILGVGVGESVVVRVDRTVMESHTEWTRLIAEHGALGLVVIACMSLLLVRGVHQQRFAWARGWSLAFGVWTAVDLAHSATRIAAPSLAFALVLFTFTEPLEVVPGSEP